jgi:hypothetical protein
MNGVSYVIGHGKFDLNLDKTVNLLHRKLMIVNMCARFIKPKSKNDDGKKLLKEDFHVYITVPPIMYEAMSDKMPNLLVGDYKVKQNGREKQINIKKVTVVPETYLVLGNHNKTDKYKNKTLIILDIGGLTSNLVKVTNGMFAFDDETYITIDAGMYNIDQKIASLFMSKGYPLDVLEVKLARDSGELIDESGKVNLWDKYAEDIQEIYNDHFENLITAMRSKKWNFRTAEFLVTGGGGFTLFDTAKTFFAKAELSEDFLFDNIRGLEDAMDDEEEDEEVV